MNQVLRAIMSTGALYCGSTPYGLVAGEMDENRRARAVSENPGLLTLLVAAYAYDGGGESGNLSRYARSTDYHLVVRQRLSIAGNILRARYPGRYFRPYVDASPFPEVYAAACAGLGVIGKHGLLITDRGSYVFLGILATDLPMPFPGVVPDYCAACDACVRLCPTGALSERGLDTTRCLSALTQRKGELSLREQAAIRRGGMVWGCDVCQTVCPLNHAPAPAHPALQPLRSSLQESELAISDEEFAERYGDCAFSWRGAQPLRRNLAILKEGWTELLSRAQEALRTGEVDEAEALCAVCADELPTGEPLWRTLWLVRAVLHQLRGAHAQARADLEALVQSAPTPQEKQRALLLLADGARLAGDMSGLSRALAQEEALGLPPSPFADARRRTLYGYLALSQGDFDGAQRRLIFALRDARMAKDSACLARVNLALADLSDALGRGPTARKRRARARHSFQRAGELREARALTELLAPAAEAGQ